MLDGLNDLFYQELVRLVASSSVWSALLVSAYSSITCFIDFAFALISNTVQAVAASQAIAASYAIADAFPLS